uniref:Uncharacterized protein n=1 Tax=Trichobilharzia regenti TaxID=157069 RepID=A0AA85IPL6_TRIRE|nr:unnamed protein product [Trichobilharzia regenti]
MRFAYITLVLLVSLFAVAKNVNGEQNGNSAVQQKTLLQSFWDWLSGILKFLCSLSSFVDIFVQKSK